MLPQQVATHVVTHVTLDVQALAVLRAIPDVKWVVRVEHTVHCNIKGETRIADGKDVGKTNNCYNNENQPKRGTPVTS